MDNIAVQAADRAHSLDESSQQLLSSIKRKDNLFRIWFSLTWTILLILAIFGLYKQNEIANANKQHIDCIVKYFVTPLPPGKTHKLISDASNACHINFTH